jgi:hypothetical protein
MNSLPMIAHCGYHQRVVQKEAVCPHCGYVVYFRLNPARMWEGGWHCENHCAFIAPTWRELNARDCPIGHAD